MMIILKPYLLHNTYYHGAVTATPVASEVAATMKTAAAAVAA